MSSMQGVIKRLMKDNSCSTTVYWLYGPCISCAIKLPLSAINIIVFSCFGPYLYSYSLSLGFLVSCHLLLFKISHILLKIYFLIL